MYWPCKGLAVYKGRLITEVLSSQCTISLEITIPSIEYSPSWKHYKEMLYDGVNFSICFNTAIPFEVNSQSLLWAQYFYSMKQSPGCFLSIVYQINLCGHITDSNSYFVYRETARAHSASFEWNCGIKVTNKLNTGFLCSKVKPLSDQRKIDN